MPENASGTEDERQAREADMTTQPQLLQIALNPSDVVYTPDWVAKDMVEFFKPSGRVLDPCKGDGAFTKYLTNAEWCEIELGRDFFKWTEPVDWIIGNPPYGMFSEWIDYSFGIANHVCYLLPANKPFNGNRIFRNIFTWGGITHMRWYGALAAWSKLFRYPVAAVYFQRNYKGPMYTTIYGES